jgi:hypothetical protein
VPVSDTGSTKSFVNGAVSLGGLSVTRESIQQPNVLRAIKDAIVQHVNSTTGFVLFTTNDVYITNVTAIESARRRQRVLQDAVCCVCAVCSPYQSV